MYMSATSCRYSYLCISEQRTLPSLFRRPGCLELAVAALPTVLFIIRIMDNQLSPSVVGLLRGMLPDGWDHFEESSYVRCGKLSLIFDSEDSDEMEDKKTSL